MRRVYWLILTVLTLATFFGVLSLSAQEGDSGSIQIERPDTSEETVLDKIVVDDSDFYDGEADEPMRQVALQFESSALQLAANKYGLVTSDLTVANAGVTTYNFLDQEVLEYKIADSRDGLAYGIALDLNGQEVDLAQLETAEQQAYTAKYGRLSPELYDHLAVVATQEPVPVIIWLNAPPVDAARPEAGSDLDVFETQADVDAFYADVNEQLVQSTAFVVAPIVERLTNLGREVLAESSTPIIYTELTPKLIQEVATWSEVDTIYLDGIAAPALEAAYGTVQANTLYARRLAGFDIKGAVIEVGGRVATNNPYLANVIQDTTYVCSAASGHSTGVAGIIHSSHPTRFGIAPGAVLRAGGSCTGNISQLTNRSTAAMNWGARVTNHSWGRDTNLSVNNAESRFYDTMVVNNARTVVVAAGNSGLGDRQVWSPGVAYNVITVGNFNDGNTTSWSNDTMNSTSSWLDPVSDKPEVSGPGTAINSTTTTSPWTGNIGSGTSFAAPMVAGVALDLMQRNRSLQSWPEAMKAILMVSAINNIEGASRFSAKDGAGGISGHEADDVTRGSLGGWAGRSYSCSTATNYNVLTMPLVAGKRTRVAIAWDQNPSYSLYTSDPSADLDLKVISPSGSIVASSNSLDNIFEIVDFTPTVSGNYILRVYKYRCSLTPRYLGAAWWRAS